MLAGNDGCRGETWGGKKKCQELVDRTSHLRDSVRSRGPRAGAAPPQPSPCLTCCIGQVVLCWQQRVPEVVVVVMRGEQALRGRCAGPVTAPLPCPCSPNAAAAPAAPHHPTATAIPLLRCLLTYLERRKQTHAEEHDQQPWDTYQDVLSAFAQKVLMMLMVSGVGWPKAMWRT